MKKILCLMCVAALGLAACSKNKKEETANSTYNTNYNITTADARNGNTKSAKDAKYQIIDQEFDNMLAPETDYEAIPAHELQACEDSYLPLVEPDCCGKGKAKASAAVAGKAKAKAKAVSTATTRAKKVTNTTNIYYVDGNQTIPVSSTSTTKTVYSSSGSAISSSTSSSTDPVTKKTVNADGSVTTTTTYSR